MHSLCFLVNQMKVEQRLDIFSLYLNDNLHIWINFNPICCFIVVLLLGLNKINRSVIMHTNTVL